jgi:hypothetical protein
MTAAQSTVITGIVDIISARCYCGSVTFMIKRTPRLYLSSILAVLYMHRKEINFSMQLVSY